MEDRVKRLEADILDNRRDIAQNRSDIVDLKTRLAIAENNIQDIKGELTTIKSNTTWIIRLIVGGIALAVIGFIISGGMKV